MSKLLERLSDPAKSGVYRVAGEQDLREVLSGARRDLASVPLVPGKGPMLAAISVALAFPDWFGGNWDALEDCLCDLAWRAGDDGHVLLFSGAAAIAADDLGVLVQVLEAAAGFWRERGRPFFAVFVDPAGQLALAALYREAAA